VALQLTIAAAMQPLALLQMLQQQLLQEPHFLQAKRRLARAQFPARALVRR
jgi:hypothetical protein